MLAYKSFIQPNKLLITPFTRVSLFDKKKAVLITVLIETKGRLQFTSISILRVTTDQINAKRAFAIVLYKRVRIPETAQVKINGFRAKQKRP